MLTSCDCDPSWHTKTKQTQNKLTLQHIRNDKLKVPQKARGNAALYLSPANQSKV